MFKVYLDEQGKDSYILTKKKPFKNVLSLYFFYPRNFRKPILKNPAKNIFRVKEKKSRNVFF